MVSIVQDNKVGDSLKLRSAVSKALGVKKPPFKTPPAIARYRNKTIVLKLTECWLKQYKSH